MSNEPWFKRVLEEQEELSRKIISLEGALDSDSLDHLDPIDRNYLRSQLAYMKKYDTILRRRINRHIDGE